MELSHGGDITPRVTNDGRIGIVLWDQHARASVVLEPDEAAKLAREIMNNVQLAERGQGVSVLA